MAEPIDTIWFNEAVETMNKEIFKFIWVFDFNALFKETSFRASRFEVRVDLFPLVLIVSKILAIFDPHSPTQPNTLPQSPIIYMINSALLWA